jgi:hypothetical protein
VKSQNNNYVTRATSHQRNISGATEQQQQQKEASTSESCRAKK